MRRANRVPTDFSPLGGMAFPSNRFRHREIVRWLTPSQSMSAGRLGPARPFEGQFDQQVPTATTVGMDDHWPRQRIAGSADHSAEGLAVAAKDEIATVDWLRGVGAEKARGRGRARHTSCVQFLRHPFEGGTGSLGVNSSGGSSTHSPPT
jgi:hypothetical protein